jgi:hypothetical protein
VAPGAVQSTRKALVIPEDRGEWLMLCSIGKKSKLSRVVFRLEGLNSLKV